MGEWASIHTDILALKIHIPNRDECQFSIRQSDKQWWLSPCPAVSGASWHHLGESIMKIASSI
jgi:hypothetical protein